MKIVAVEAGELGHVVVVPVERLLDDTTGDTMDDTKTVVVPMERLLDDTMADTMDDTIVVVVPVERLQPPACHTVATPTHPRRRCYCRRLCVFVGCVLIRGCHVATPHHSAGAT